MKYTIEQKITKRFPALLPDQITKLIHFVTTITEVVSKNKMQNVWAHVIPAFVEGGDYTDLVQRYNKSLSFHRQVSLERNILRYGDKVGREKWAQYCQHQANKNTKEYKMRVHGMSEEEVDKFNLSRSITLNNMTLKYGDQDGKERFDNYRKLQARHGCSLDYFVEKYGVDLGTKEYHKVNQQKSLNLDQFTRKYGVTEGEVRYNKWCVGRSKAMFYSKISQQLFESLSPLIEYKAYYATSQNGLGEYNCWSHKNKRTYFYDFVIPDLKLCIEFNGDIYHANPKIYKPSDIPKFRGNYKTSIELWKEDENKIISLLEERGYNTIVVWESDYKNSPENTVARILKVINDIHN